MYKLVVCRYPGVKFLERGGGSDDIFVVWQVFLVSLFILHAFILQGELARLCAGHHIIWVRLLAGASCFNPKHPDQFWGPFSLWMLWALSLGLESHHFCLVSR